MDRFFGLDKPRGMGEDLPLIASFFDPVSLAIAEEILQEAGIPYRKRERGCGSIVRIVAGQQSFGTDLFVNAADGQRASELLAPLLEQDADTQEDGI